LPESKLFLYDTTPSEAEKRVGKVWLLFMVEARIMSYTRIRNKPKGQFVVRSSPPMSEQAIIKKARGAITMIKVEKSIIIHRPIEEVFAYLSDFRNIPQWQSGVVEVQQTPESPVGRGTRGTFVRTFLGRKIEMTVEVVEYEPNTKHTFKSTSGPMPTTVSRIFEPTAEGTKVTMAIEMQAGGFFALAEPLVARSLRRGVEADFGTLKDLLESRAVGISS